MDRHLVRAWAPYVAPYGAFLLLVELGRWLPDAVAGWLLPARVLVPAALLVGFAARGAYRELRGYRPGLALLGDVAVGLAIAALWVVPYLLLPALPRGEAFDAGLLGPERRELALALRVTGFALVTPFVEELFVRSFLLRQVERWWKGEEGDFRAIPVGHVNAASFWITTAWFTLSHVPWEWPVAAPVGALFTLWLYARRHLGAPIVAHAVANAAIAALVLAAPGDLGFFL